MSTKKLQILGSLGNNVYVQPDDPTDAPEKSVWIDTNAQGMSGGSSTASAPDYAQNDPNGAGYINGRPLWIENYTITWDGEPTDIASDFGYKISDLTPTAEDLVGQNISFIRNGEECLYPIVDYIKSAEEAKEKVNKYYGTQVCVVAIGTLSDLPEGTLIIGNAVDMTAIVIIVTNDIDSIQSGFYVINTTETSGDVTTQYYFTKLEYPVVKVDERYAEFFKNTGGGSGSGTESNIKVVSAGGTDPSTIDFSVYSAGDIILVTE